MKKLFVALLFFCLLVPCRAEDVDSVSISQEALVMALSEQGNGDSVSVYQIPQPKHLLMRSVLADGDRMLLVCQSPWGKVTFSIIDTHTGTSVYEEKGFDLQNSTIFCNQNYVFVLKPYEQLYCRDVRTGKVVWDKKGPQRILPFWMNDDYLILQEKVRVGNDSFTYYYGRNLKTGLNEWNTNMDMGDGINYAQEQGDTLYISTSDNLYQLNIKTGETHILPSKSQVVSGKRLAGQIGIGVAAAATIVATAGLMAGGGYYAYPIYVGNNRPMVSTGSLLASNNIPSYALADVCSPVLSCDSSLFYADSKNLYCLDRSLNPVWTVTLPKHRASNSCLYQVGDTLVMANHGAAYLGGTKWREMGRPFIATYRMQDGEQLSYHELSEDREAHPQNFVSSGKVLSLTDEKIYCMSLPDTTIQMVRWDTAQYGGIQYVAEGSCYKINAESYRFDSLAVGLECVITNRGEAYRASTTADPELVASRSVRYIILGALRENVYLVAGGNDGRDLWIIRRSGEPIYHFSEPVNIHSISRSAILYTKPDRKDETLYIAKLRLQ